MEYPRFHIQYVFFYTLIFYGFFSNIQKDRFAPIVRDSEKASYSKRLPLSEILAILFSCLYGRFGGFAYLHPNAVSLSD